MSRRHPGRGIQTIARYRLDEEKRDGGDYDRPPLLALDGIRLLADGTLRPCLHCSEGFPVDFGDVEGSIRRAVLAKPQVGHRCEGLAPVQIGG